MKTYLITSFMTFWGILIVMTATGYAMKQMLKFKKHLFMLTILSAFMLLIFSCSDSDSPSSPQAGVGGSTNCIRVSPSGSGSTMTVGNVTELVNAVAQANGSGNMTIVLKDGTYTLDNMLWISGNNLTFRSSSGNRDAVVIRGQGMSGGVSHIFNVVGDNFIVANMTIGWVANHGVQIHRDSDNAIIHNVRFVDTYEQMLKVSFQPGDSTSSDNGLVEWCLFEYSAGIGPQYYIGGIDAHQAHNWVIRHNVFRHIRSPESALSEHAIHFWSDSSNTLVEHNIITNCDRGIGFGMGNEGHIGGMIRNNMVHTTRDVGIILENSSGTAVYNNTVYTENYGNSIEYRFSGTQGVSIINNLTNAEIRSRDGGAATVATNVTSAQASWFADAGSGDLHLVSAEPSVLDQGQTLLDVTQDIDCDPRPQGAGYDIGADER
jgi:parallel beta-helix repeat protein